MSRLSKPKINSVKDMQDARERCLGSPLKNNEKRIITMPQFEIRKDPNDGKDYGRHGLEVFFMERRGSVALATSFMTGIDSVEDNSPSNPRWRHDPICTGFSYHSKKKGGEYDSKTDDCHILGGKCWSSLGSAIYGDTILDRWMNEGSAGVWSEFDQEFKRLQNE